MENQKTRRKVMKKKAIISTVASVVLAGVMCVGFAACADKAESMKGEEVTAEQWAEAFKAENFENVKVEGTSKTTTEMGEISGKSTTEVKTVIADGKAYYKLSAEGSGEGEDAKMEKEQYEEKVEGATVIYTKNDDGAWVKTEGGYGIAFGMVSQYTALATQYENFEYNADKKGYVQKNGGDSEFGEMVYKFKDGKLAAIWAEIDEEEEELGIKMSVKGTYSILFTYGGQSVDIPAVA